MTQNVITIDRDRLERELAKLKKQEHETAITALEDAEVAKHEREEAAAVAAKAHAKNCEDLAAAATALLDDTAEAQSLAKEFASVTARRLEHVKRIARLFYAVSRGVRAPADLTLPQVEVRLGNELAPVLASVPGCKNRLGGIELHANPFYDATTDWVSALKTVLERHVDPILRKEESK
jgi:hypothetical protein